MIIAIDAGNTAVSFGLFRGNRLILKTSVPTRECKSKFGKELMRLLHSGKMRTGSDNYCIVASVVPVVDKIIKNSLQKAGIRYFFISPLNAGVSIRCREPGKVGVDRLMNAVAAHGIYKKGAIIVDCGTATTFDIMSPEGEYLGGAIAPGINIGAEALAEKCEKLFPVKPDFPRFAVGRNTKEAMLSGIVLGHIAMTEGMIGKLKRELKFKPIIVGTGGLVKLIAKGTKIFDAIDSDLTLKGLVITGTKSCLSE
jgi:type III pantothenate kinase